MSKKANLADPFPEGHDPSGEFYRELRLPKKQLNFHLFRVLLSKLLYTKETFTEEDEILLFSTYERMVELCADPVFKDKCFWLIWINRNIFHGLPEFVKSPTARHEQKKILDSFFSNGRSQLNAFIYYGAQVSVKVRMQTCYPKKPKERNRIGVGYRDKGNASNAAWDGSPSWQEVATDEWFQIHNLGNSLAEKIEQLWQFFRVGNFQPWLKGIRRNRSTFCTLMHG